MGVALKFIGLTIVSHFAITAADTVFHKAKDAYKKRKKAKGCDSEEATI